MTEAYLPFITIAMPVRNEERFIAQTLADILKQDYPEDYFEIIVADGESTDSTRRIVEKIARNHPQVILMHNPGRLPSAGRNIGFKNGRGDIFLVIDGHCSIANERLLKSVADCFEKSGAQCLGRPQPFGIPEKPTMQKAIALARSSWLGHSTNSYIHSTKEGSVSPVSVGCAYKREVFSEIGFVDESFDACEDVEFNYRVEKAGFKSFFSPKIAVSYYPRENLTDLWRQLVRYGTGRFNFMYKHPENFNLEMFVPVAFTVGILTIPFLGLLHSFFAWAYVAIICIYLILVLGESIRLNPKRDLVFTLKLMVTFPTIHFALGFGIIRGACQKILQPRTRDNFKTKS